MPAKRLPAFYAPRTPPRYTRRGGSTEKNVRRLCDNRGLRLRVQPGKPGSWRVQDKRTGDFLRCNATLRQLRKWLVTQKTMNHKARERKYRRTLPPHPWAATS